MSEGVYKPEAWILAQLTPKSGSCDECEHELAVHGRGSPSMSLKKWSQARFMCTQAGMNFFPRPARQTSKCTAVVLNQTWPCTVEVRNLARRSLSTSLKLKPASIVTRKTPACMDVLYTGAENCNKHKQVAPMVSSSSCVSAICKPPRCICRHLLYWTVCYICKHAWNGVTECES